MTCVWEPDPACLTDEWDALDEPTKNRSLMLATSSLIDLTYGRVGTCPIVVRPCNTEPRCGCGWAPRIHNGQWVNGCSHQSTCAPLSEVILPGPVGEVFAIIVDGEVIAAQEGWGHDDFDLDVDADVHDAMKDFRVDNGNSLVWQGDGPSPFPETQDLNKPLTAAGTWGVVYRQSAPVGPDASLAVAYLAMEFAKACKKSKVKCSLPKGVTSVVRAGVSFTVDAGLFLGGLTNNEIVDAFILKWAPAGSPRQGALVFTPRMAARSRRTTLDTGLGRRFP